MKTSKKILKAGALVVIITVVTIGLLGVYSTGLFDKTVVQSKPIEPSFPIDDVIVKPEEENWEENKTILEKYLEWKYKNDWIVGSDWKLEKLNTNPVYVKVYRRNVYPNSEWEKVFSGYYEDGQFYEL